MPEWRRFNRNDWQFLQGAERFDDGSDPLILERDSFIAVSSPDGLEVIWHLSGFFNESWRLSPEVPTANIMFKLANEEVRREHLRSWGFEQILGASEETS